MSVIWMLHAEDEDRSVVECDATGKFAAQPPCRCTLLVGVTKSFTNGFHALGLIAQCMLVAGDNSCLHKYHMMIVV